MKFIVTVSALALLIARISAKPIEGCLQNHTITATDSCVSVAAQFQITEADFYAMNPGLHHSAAHDCDNLDTGKPFCVCIKSPCPVSESAASISSGTAGNSTNVVSSASGSVSTAVSSVTSSVSSPASSTSTAVLSVASAASSAASSAVSSPSASASATSDTAAKTIFGAMTAALVVAATSAIL